MKILGLNTCFTSNHHDPSAALLVNGELLAAVEEERLNRIKGSLGYFPLKAIRECLKLTGISIYDIDLISAPGINSPDLVSKINHTSALIKM